MPTLLKSIAATNVPVLITGVNTLFNSAVFYGYSGFAGGLPLANSGTLYIGTNTGQLFMQVFSNDYLSWSAPDRIKESLNNFYVQGTVGDALYISYY